MNSDSAEAEPSRQAPPAGRKPAARRFGGYAALVAAGILLSRIAGLIRTRVFAHYLGDSAAADAFTVAQKVPNFLQNLLGEGVLSGSFIPVYARLVAQGDEKLAGRVAGVFVSILGLAVSVFVLLGVLLARVILTISAPGLDGATLDLAVTCVRIIFPGTGVLVLSAWCLGVLNTHKQFFLSYIAPVLWNVAQIATLVMFGRKMANDDLAVALAWGLVVGCALQFLIQVPFVFRHARELSFGIDTKLQAVRTMFRNLGPVVGGRGVVQISSYIDQFIASLLPTGAITNLLYAQVLYTLPVSVFGMSVAAAELTEMSSETGSEEEVRRALRRRLDRGIRQIAFFVVPTTVAFILIGRVLVAALYQGGEFTAETTMLVWYALLGSSVGLLVSTLGRLYSSTFYALHDTKTPFRYAAARVTLSAVLAFLFAFPLRWIFPAALRVAGLPIPHVDPTILAIVGITFASGIAAWAEFLLLRRGIRARIGKGEPKVAYFGKLWIAAVAAGAAALAFDRFIGRDLTARLPLPYINEAIAASAVFGVVYFGLGFALGVPEVRATLSRLVRR